MSAAAALPTPPRRRPRKKEPLLARALFPFDNGVEGELTLDEGDVVTVLERDEGGWWRGEKVDGTRGLFPYNYVELHHIHDDNDPDGPRQGGQDASRPSSFPRHRATPSETAAAAPPPPPAPSYAHAHVAAGAGGGSNIMALSFRPPDIEAITIASVGDSTVDARGDEDDGGGGGGGGGGGRGHSFHDLTHAGGPKKFTVYNVEVRTTDGRVRVAAKRYREFRALQDALKKTFPVVGQQLHHKMQSKMADRLEHFRRFADSVVEKRRNMLQAYLQDLANMPSVAALLMAWLFQGEKAEVQGMRPTTKAPAQAVGEAVAIAHWVGADEAELSFHKGDSITVFRHLKNGWVEAADKFGHRGMAPSSYLTLLAPMPISPSAAASSSAAAAATAVTTAASGNASGSAAAAAAAAPSKAVGGIEKFQLESCEAFDQLMDEGFAVEFRPEEDGGAGEDKEDAAMPSEGDAVEVELVGMLWDDLQVHVTQFIQDSDLGEPCVLVLGEGLMTRGLDLAIQTMRVGQHAMVVVTPPLAFGEVGAPEYGVPASVHVVFDVKLTAITSSGGGGGGGAAAAATAAAATATTTTTTAEVALLPIPEQPEERRRALSSPRRGHRRTGSKGGMSLERRKTPNAQATQRGRKGRIKLIDPSPPPGKDGEEDFSQMSDAELMQRAAAMMGLGGAAGAGGEAGGAGAAVDAAAGVTAPPPPRRKGSRARMPLPEVKKAPTPKPERRPVPPLPDESGGGGGNNEDTKGGSPGPTRKERAVPPPAPRRATKSPPPAAAPAELAADESQPTAAPAPASARMTIPYAELCLSKGGSQEGIDRTKLEHYLSDTEFVQVLGMDRETFAALPGWRRKKLKVERKLF